MQWIHITKEDILKKFQHATVVNFKLDHGSIDRKCYDEDTVKLIMDSYAHADYVNIAVDGHKVFFVDEVRKLLNELYKEEISLSKFIEELNVKANHPEPTGSGWIDCKDRFPDPNEAVLVTNGERIKETIWMKRTSKDEYHFMFTTMKNITHWMSIKDIALPGVK